MCPEPHQNDQAPVLWAMYHLQVDGHGGELPVTVPITAFERYTLDFVLDAVGRSEFIPMRVAQLYGDSVSLRPGAWSVLRRDPIPAAEAYCFNPTDRQVTASIMTTGGEDDPH